LDTIVRVSLASARLHLSDVVTVEIVKKALAYITRILKAFDSSVEVVEDPRDAINLGVADFVMKTPNMPFKFSDCVNYVITSNRLVESYLGPSPVNTETHKYRDARERFIQSPAITNGLISIESYNPLTLVFKVQVKNDERA
jgi:hypothetical protein